MNFKTFLSDLGKDTQAALGIATEVAAVAEPEIDVLDPTVAPLYNSAVNLFLAGETPGQTSTQGFLNIVAATATLIQQIKGGTVAAAAAAPAAAAPAPAAVVVQQAAPAPAAVVVQQAAPAPAAVIHPAVAVAAAAISAALMKAPGPGLHTIVAA